MKQQKSSSSKKQPYISPELIEKLIQIPTTTYESNHEIVAFLKPLYEAQGLQTVVQQVVEDGKKFYNLLAFNQKLDSPGLLVFNNHLDTVSGGESELWTKTGGNPFQATFVRNRVYGLGSADVKLNLLCLLKALEQLGGKVTYPICVVGTYGEERGLIGAQKLFPETGLCPKYAFVSEPSELALIYAHKGHMIVEVSLEMQKPGGKKNGTLKNWSGQSAHSSTPQKGKNALVLGLRDLQKRGMGFGWLQSGTNFNRIPEKCEAIVTGEPSPANLKVFGFLKFLEELQSELKQHRNSKFDPAFSTVSLNVAQMQKDRLHFTFDVRLIPETSVEPLKKKLQAGFKKMGLQLESLVVDPPLKGHARSELMKLSSKVLKDLKIPVSKKTKASSTEAAIYHQQGAEAIVFGPGISVGNVHRPNEFNTFDQLKLASLFYQGVLQSASERL